MSAFVTINTLALESASLEAHISLVAALGADGLTTEVDAIVAAGAPRAAGLLADAGLVIGTLTHRAFGFSDAALCARERSRLMRTIDVAHRSGAPSICFTSGGRGGLPWSEAASRFAEAIAPCLAAARDAGVRLGLEPTSHLFTDVSLAHRLRDVIALARMADLDVGLDIFACWADSDIEAAIAAAGSSIAFVQVSDYVLGDRALPCRAFPGDGAIPLERLIGVVLATGFRGCFDIEVLGPRIEIDRKAGLERGLTMVRAAIAHGLAEPARPAISS